MRAQLKKPWSSTVSGVQTARGQTCLYSMSGEPHMPLALPKLVSTKVAEGSLKDLQNLKLFNGSSQFFSVASAVRVAVSLN